MCIHNKRPSGAQDRGYAVFGSCITATAAILRRCICYIQHLPYRKNHPATQIADGLRCYSKMKLSLVQERKQPPQESPEVGFDPVEFVLRLSGLLNTWQAVVITLALILIINV